MARTSGGLPRLSSVPWLSSKQGRFRVERLAAPLSPFIFTTTLAIVMWFVVEQAVPSIAEDVLPDAVSSYVIQGRVTDEDERPIAGAIVYWRPVARHFDSSERTQTNALGRYQLPVEKVGPWHRLWVSAEHFAPSQVDIWAFEPPGVPTIADTTLKHYNSGPLACIHHGKSTENGRFHFHEAPDELGTLFILHGQYERLILRPEDRVIDAETGLVRVELDPEASISGMCLIEDEPQMDVGVSFWMPGRQEDPKQSFEKTATNESGQYRFGSLVPGTYVVHSQAGPGEVGLSRKCKLNAGEEIRLNLGDDLGPYLLRGHVVLGKQRRAWMHIRLEPLFDWEYTMFETVSDAEARYEIRGLPAG